MRRAQGSWRRPRRSEAHVHPAGSARPAGRRALLAADRELWRATRGSRVWCWRPARRQASSRPGASTSAAASSAAARCSTIPIPVSRFYEKKLALMTDLTSLTIAAGAREAARQGDLRGRAHRRLSRGDRRAPIPLLNAYVAVTPDKARAMAKASDARLAKGEGGALEGIPLGIKDLFATEGVHTQAGSHILDGFKPLYELTVTANLWADGAVMLGKLNMDEFAMGSSNETSYYGPVINPWRRRARPASCRQRIGDAASYAGGARTDAGQAAGAGGSSAARPRRFGISAPAPPPPTPAARSASRPPSPAPSASSRPMAAARAGASSPSPPRSTRPGRSPATCAMPRSC